MVTNDGATILKNIGVDNPAAKVLVGESYFLNGYVNYLNDSHPLPSLKWISEVLLSTWGSCNHRLGSFEMTQVCLAELWSPRPVGPVGEDLFAVS